MEQTEQTRLLFTSFVIQYGSQSECLFVFVFLLFIVVMITSTSLNRHSLDDNQHHETFSLYCAPSQPLHTALGAQMASTHAAEYGALLQLLKHQRLIVDVSLYVR